MNLQLFRDEASRDRALGALRKLQLFAGLGPEQQDRLLTICHGCQFLPGEVIFRAGDPSLEMYVLLSGEVEVCTEAGATLGTLGANEILGEMGLICEIRRTATAIARQQAAVLRISRQDFDHLIDREPRAGVSILRNVVRYLTDRLVRSNEERSAAPVPHRT